MKIKAAVVREKSGPFKIEDIELDEPRDDEVLVRIVGSWDLPHRSGSTRSTHAGTPARRVRARGVRGRGKGRSSRHESKTG